MYTLPLYNETPQAIVALTDPLARDPNCKLCEFGEKAKTVCMPAEGEPGGVLLVAEMPGRVEDSVGRPFAGGSGKYLRGLVKKWHRGKVAFDNAVRCAPHGKEVKEKHIRQCRPYGASIIEAVQPKRIILLGSAAIQAYLGRRPPVMSVRKGYGWYINPLDDFIPIFYTMNPAAAMRNRFMQEWFEEDLKWALTCDEPKAFFNGTTNVVENREDAEKAFAEVIKHEWFAYDVETHGQMHNSDFRCEAVTVLDDETDVSWTFGRKALKDAGCRDVLKRLLEHDRLGVVTQNGKYDDRSVLLDLKANVQNIRFDTRLARKMLEPDTDASLGVLAELVGMGGHKEEAEDAVTDICKELNYQADPPSGLTPTGKVRKVKPPAFYVPQATLDQIKIGVDPKAFAFGFMNEELLYTYNARDVHSTRNLTRELLEQQMKDNPFIWRMWNDVMVGQNRAVRHIENWGFAVDKGAVHTAAAFLATKKEEHKKRMMAWGEFNPDSVPQLRKKLFEDLSLPVIAETDTGLESTGKDALEELEGKHPIITELTSYRKYNTLSKFTAGWIASIREDGRIHASFLPDGAGSGRMSSQGPNMQNVPSADRDPILGKMMRDCFIAPIGHVLLEADFSQLELRIAAMLSGDPEMIADYVKGIDIHQNNARECAPYLWSIPHAKWDAMTVKEQKPYRSKIKTGTFGKLYGKSDRGLAKEMGCSLKEVQDINARIWGRYKRLDAWTRERLADSRKSGECWTWWKGQKGRRRPLTKIADPEDGIRENAERSSWNTPIQGTAAEFMNASLWPIIKWIIEDAVPAKVVGTVHDSIILEVREDVLEEVGEMVWRILTGWPSGGVPIEVDMKWGTAWGSLDKKFVPKCAAH